MEIKPRRDLPLQDTSWNNGDVEAGLPGGEPGLKFLNRREGIIGNPDPRLLGEVFDDLRIDEVAPPIDVDNLVASIRRTKDARHEKPECASGKAKDFHERHWVVAVVNWPGA